MWAHWTNQAVRHRSKKSSPLARSLWMKALFTALELTAALLASGMSVYNLWKRGALKRACNRTIFIVASMLS
jgi:hypothetical protein